MPAYTPNLNLAKGFLGELVGDWRSLVNPNWDALDALFSAVRSTSPGGTGHVHSGAPGQGPNISHLDLINVGSKTHADIDSDLASILARLTFVEGNYCADPSCGAGQSGTGHDPHPPLHYTDNFATVQGTRLAQNDWLVQSDSGLADFQTTGRSALLSTLMGLKCVDRYAAVVKCQIPHSTAQRITYHIDRFTANGLQDTDGIIMTMALMSTHLLGAVSSTIQKCGIKFVLALYKAGGLYVVNRFILSEVSDGQFTLLKQDIFTGLAFGAAEAHFRGCHEFSTDEDGAVWYYHNRAPIYMLPAGSVSQAYPGIQQTLLGLGEPPYGSIGFGWAWCLDPSASFDVDLAWLTIDSKANVEDDYTTSYGDPGNEPLPFDPTPGVFCCGGGGPQIGAMVDLGDGLELEAIACVDTPFQGVLLSNGDIFPCGLYTPPSGGDLGPESITEGFVFVREIPIVNMTPPANTEYVIANEDVFEFVHVEINQMGATVTGRLKDGSFGMIDPTITFTQKTDPTNTYGPVTLCMIAAGALSIANVEFFDPFYNPLPSLPEGGFFWVKVTTTGFVDPGPFPKALGADLAIVGDVSSVTQKYLRANNELWALVRTNDEQPPYDPLIQKVTITVTRGPQTDAADYPVVEASPEINGIVITADSGGPAPFTLAPGATITFDLYGWGFDNGAILALAPGSPHVIAAQPAFTDRNTLQGAQITIGGGALPMDPIDILVVNPSGQQSGGGSPQAIALVLDAVAFTPGPAITTELDGTAISAPFEGQWHHTVMTVDPPRAALPMYSIEGMIGAAPIPWDHLRNYECFADRVEFDWLAPSTIGPPTPMFTLLRYQSSYSSTASVGGILAEPSPTGTPTAGPLYPGVTGTIIIQGAGDVFLPGLRVYGNPSTDVTIDSVSISTPFSKITVTYTVSTTAVSGTPVSLQIENLLGVVAVVPLGNITRPPVVVDSIEVSDCENVEGRKNVPFVVSGEHFDPTAAISIVAGPGSVHDVVWVSDTEMTFQADFPVAPAGGTPYTVEISNPAPDPSSTSVNLTLGAEPTPRVGIILNPATPGVGRTIKLIGANLYCIDDVVPSNSIFSFTNLANVVWTRRSNLLWEGTCDVTGAAGQQIVADVTTPGGQTYTGIATATIRAPSLIPLPTGFTPAVLETATDMPFRIDGADFDSVSVVRAITAGLVPIGAAQTVPMTIQAMTSDWIIGKVTLPNGMADLPFDIEFYDATLALLATMPAAFTGAKGALTPHITNKGVAFSTTPGAGPIAVTFTLDPATPVVNPAAWSITNGALISATDMSGGAGTAWQLIWTNGVAGDFEIRVAAPVLPVTFDVVRRVLA